MPETESEYLENLWREAWTPPDRQDVRKWAEEHIESIPYSPIPGRFRIRISLIPHARATTLARRRAHHTPPPPPLPYREKRAKFNTLPFLKRALRCRPSRTHTCEPEGQHQTKTNTMSDTNDKTPVPADDQSAATRINNLAADVASAPDSSPMNPNAVAAPPLPCPLPRIYNL